jgi:HK97 family phage major capsid protein
VRTNAATAVADNALKPTSTLTVEPIEDRARVIAHLSEPCPIRIWYDHESFVAWLTSEMVGGVLDGLEQQIISGDGSGENMTGLLNTPGTTQVPFDTDVATSLRSGLTQLQLLGELPTGWALHPTDAQAVDLERAAPSDGPFLSEGYQTGVAPGQNPSSNNIFGPGFTRVVSPSVPEGVAILGDFTKLRVYVREDAHMDVDASGVLFTKNQFVARGEGRYGIGVLRPSAFAVCDLSATTTSRSSKGSTAKE